MARMINGVAVGRNGYWINMYDLSSVGTCEFTIVSVSKSRILHCRDKDGNKCMLDINALYTFHKCFNEFRLEQRRKGRRYDTSADLPGVRVMGVLGTGPMRIWNWSFFPAEPQPSEVAENERKSETVRDPGLPT